ncbi:N-acetylmuramoyl-L-alanine amidase [Paenibacillus sp. UNC496MF]|uniref:N-acetylmuramoyl-L-alanine amidase family protein n=1 Tax=Paenibacillus sp. UNC496MF TaxID=1502753 RepID=UPI0008E28C77|nr:N-acetylmuramoyl-L-alanine amidase [Paenibacillus sp. UNC496MF]SFI27548.1 N-acetylmuramoyl-L-alanine amidase [Paenibacillus sp. UNC496MF]
MTTNTRLKYIIGFIAALLVLLAAGRSLLAQIGGEPDGAKSLTGSPRGETGAPEEYESSGGRFKIVIDPGHGGKDPGSAGASGQWEKDSNLALAMKLYELLKGDPLFEPRLTRTDDTFVELADRAQVADGWGADALISIHGNAFEDASVAGTETYYTHPDSLGLAEAIHGKVVAALGFPDRGVKEEKLKVLSLSEMPAVLVEPGYLTNAAEEAFMLGDDGQRTEAEAIADGLRAYFAGGGADPSAAG